MAESTYTLKQISELLGVPGSTLRWYAATFAEHLPVAASGRPRRYTAEGLEGFELIRACYSQGFSKREIREALASRLSPGHADAAQPINAGTYGTESMALVAQLAGALSTMASQKELLDKLDRLSGEFSRRLDALEKRFSDLDFKVRTMRRDLDEASRERRGLLASFTKGGRR